MMELSDRVRNIDRGKDFPGIMSSKRVRDKLRESGPVLLGFSRGKDSIAAWCALEDAGVDVIPFHLYRIPGLRFEAESIDYFQDAFKTRIYQLPHPYFWQSMVGYQFQTPERCATIDAAHVTPPTYEQIVDMLREYFGVPDAWYVDGVSANNSLVRRTAIKTHGVMKPKHKKAHPIWDWALKDVRETIEGNSLELPPDYTWFAKNPGKLDGRSFDGLDARFLGPLKKFAPDDYQRLLDWYPLASTEADRWEKTHA